MNLAHNSVIEELICSNNQISSLDISNQPELKWLECENNQLAYLNLRNGNSFYSILASNNPTLTCIEVDNANESYLDWTGSNYSFDTQHYFHGIISYGWVDAAIFPPTSAGGYPGRDLVVDNNNITYNIEANEVYKYDPSSSNSWISIGDSAHALALDQSNNLYKVYLEKYYTNNPQQGVYMVTKVALKIMNYTGSSWILNSVDTIYSHTAPSNISNFNLYGVFKIEDFLIDPNNNAYISLMKNEYTLDVYYDYSKIIIKKYHINTNSWNTLTDPGLIKYHYNWASFGGLFNNWYITKDLNTCLDINPINGKLIIAGQQGNCTMNASGWCDPVYLTDNVVKEWNGLTWSLLGSPLPLSNFAHKPGGSFLATNDTDLICAFTSDAHEFSDPYGDDTLMIYKYNFTTLAWEPLAGGNPYIEMYYVNSMSIDINSYGEPAIAFDGVPWPPYLAMMTGMQVVLKYDNNLHAWDTIASPVDGSLPIQEGWYLPIIRFNSDDQPFINYLEEVSLGGAYGYTVKLQQGDSSLCGSTVSVPEINTHLAVNTNKKLIKIIDILGRETKVNKNQPLFYIYDDGTVEKKVVVE